MFLVVTHNRNGGWHLCSKNPAPPVFSLFFPEIFSPPKFGVKCHPPKMGGMGWQGFWPGKAKLNTVSWYMPKSQVLEKGIRYSYRMWMSIVIPWNYNTLPSLPECTIGWFFWPGKADLDTVSRYMPGGKCCPFLFLRAIRRPNDVFGHSIDAIFQRYLTRTGT